MLFNAFILAHNKMFTVKGDIPVIPTCATHLANKVVSPEHKQSSVEMCAPYMIFRYITAVVDLLMEYFLLSNYVNHQEKSLITITVLSERRALFQL
jgi:uncharacterized membrane protein (GlpM family)